MKTKIYKGLLTALFSVGLLSCTDQLDRQFYNPDTYNIPESEVAGGLFSGTISEWKIYTQDYGEYWWNFGGLGSPAMIQVGLRPFIKAYDGVNNYLHLLDGQGYNDANHIRTYFYDMNLRTNAWGILKNLLEKNDEAWRAENEIYYNLVSLVREYVMLRNVDFFNSIPYSEAGLGAQGIVFSKYDDPHEITKQALEGIKNISGVLQDNYDKMSSKGQAFFAKQDFIFHGDVNKWIQYANSLRLKFAVRVSGVDEALAKEHISDVLNSSIGLPQDDFTYYLGYDVLAQTLVGGGETWTRGLYERFTSIFIPNVIMKRMNYGEYKYEPGIDDPRLPVIATPTLKNEYIGVRPDVNYELNEPLHAELKKREKPADIPQETWDIVKDLYILNNGNYRNDLDVYLNVNQVSCYNLQTYIFGEFPVVMVTKAEIDLLLSEVALKNLGSTGKSAEDHLVDALKSSTKFWYYVNSLSKYNPTQFKYFPNTDISVLKPEMPSDSDISTYANALKANYSSSDDKLEVIMQQKYIHLNIMDNYELWAELRRTRRPKLEPFTSSMESMQKPMLERGKYNINEMGRNFENYKKVMDQDNYTSPIFWVKDPNESFFRDTYIE